MTTWSELARWLEAIQNEAMAHDIRMLIRERFNDTGEFWA